MGHNIKSDVKIVMLDHSKAKVNLYTNYLATYLNILSRVPFISKIHIYDLMCGEGIYADNSEGSPIVALKKIKDHFFSNEKHCPNIEVWFNDKDKSEIEKDKYKVDRVKEKSSSIFKPDNVNVKFTKEDYVEIYPRVIKKINSLGNNEKILLFIDPYGYKEIKIEHLRKFLSNRKTELLLFLPISFMSRVANKSLSKDEFPGGESLKEFLLPLFGKEKELKSSTKPYIFINQLKFLLRNYLKKERIFVDTFTIERNKQNVYSLFFFTPNALGFEKMLNTKWKLDEARGKGFRINSEQESFFDEIEVLDYPNTLKNFIATGETKTNSDLYIFGLNNGFLPKHTNKVLKRIQDSHQNFKVYLSNGNQARKSSFYISYENYGSHPKQIVKFLFE